MKQKVAKEIQKLLKCISLNSIGRSAPIGIYEKKISRELENAVSKMRKSKLIF